MLLPDELNVWLLTKFKRNLCWTNVNLKQSSLSFSNLVCLPPLIKLTFILFHSGGLSSLVNFSQRIEAL